MNADGSEQTRLTSNEPAIGIRPGVPSGERRRSKLASLSLQPAIPPVLPDRYRYQHKSSNERRDRQPHHHPLLPDNIGQPSVNIIPRK